VLLVGREIIRTFALCKIAPKTDMPLEMMQVAILTVICKRCCLNRFPTPDVTICTENVAIPAFGDGILCPSGRLNYPAEYFLQRLSVCLPLLIQPLLRINAVLHWNRQESDHYNAVG